jgi:hypothetical protein
MFVQIDVSGQGAVEEKAVTDIQKLLAALRVGAEAAGLSLRVDYLVGNTAAMRPYEPPPQAPVPTSAAPQQEGPKPATATPPRTA